VKDPGERVPVKIWLGVAPLFRVEVSPTRRQIRLHSSVAGMRAPVREYTFPMDDVMSVAHYRMVVAELMRRALDDLERDLDPATSTTGQM